MPFKTREEQNAYNREYYKKCCLLPGWSERKRMQNAAAKLVRKQRDPELWRRDQAKYNATRRARYPLAKREMAMARLGITIELADRLLSDGCGICGSQATVIDHCHQTGKVRGGLCHNCNTGIGLFKDDPIRLHRAIRYLTKKRA